MTPVPIEIIDTKILKPFKYPRLVHEGYLYHFHKKCSRHLRWKCNRVYSFKCPAVLKTNLDLLNPRCVAIDHEHVHGDDSIAVEQLKLKLRVLQTSTLIKKNICFKSNDLDKFDEEIHSPDNKLVRFCASMNEIYIIDPLDPDHEYGNAKSEEIIKINNSKDTSFNFENCSYTRLQQQNNQKQIIIENGITDNHTNYSSLKKCIQKRRGRPPKKKNMIVSEKKENDTQNNEITLLTNTHKETNILTTDTPKEINNLTTNTRKVKNSLINDVHKNKNTLRNKKNKNTYILTKNNRKGKKSLVSGIKNEKNISTANSNTSKRSLTTNIHTQKNIITTRKQKNKNSLITNVNGITISSKVKKYTSKFTNQKSNTNKNSPIIISTSTITSTSTTLTSPIKSIPKIEGAPTALKTTIICTPTIVSTPTVTSTPIIESLPTIKMAHTIERCMNKSIDYEDNIVIISDNEDDDSNFNFFEVDNEEVNNKINEIDLKDYDFMILTDLKKNLPTIESTSRIINTPTIENTFTIVSTPTVAPTIKSTSIITSTPIIESTFSIESTPTVTSTPIIRSLPSIKMTDTIERYNMNIKNIDYEDDIIFISDDEDDDSILNFFEVNDDEENNNEIDEINEIDLKDYEIMIFTDLKKYWPTILNKMSDPLTGIKVFESILLNKLLLRMIRGNIKTKKKLEHLYTSINYWKTKYDCLSHQIKTLVNSTKSDKNTRLINIQDKNVKDTTLCSNIGVDKQANNIDIKKKELKSDITPDNLKTSKLYQQSLKSKNKYLSESASDIMTSKSEEIKTNISSYLLCIPSDLTITEQNNLTQSDSLIKINQSKDNESNELFTPVSDVTKALELSPKSLKRKISNLIKNNTSIEIIKPKFVNK
ncbi:probable protein phosphatase DDB_G0282105 isoform X2 [Rhopalosiphum maidis]|uniref:probable protein phosphatase DDB_G0282105 isoform X2 n=1 Tax=Rhopalosiphum maidis TaxID=43146 RepID=UPI000EFED2EE|nr:probable protein phosphatase DDB_G0282105 isoform X2 [Rhopalosiphum maidis]